MKKTVLPFLFILLCAPLLKAGFEPYEESRSLYDHLVEINANWAKYIHDEGAWATPVAFNDDQSFIAADLTLVEQFLRSKDVSALSPALQKERKRNLDVFHEYIVEGKFPKNYDHEERRPCFIDRDGGVCAVGNLLVKSGEKDLAYYIADNYQYAYVKDMNVEQLVDWQKTSGLTLEELSLIQPSYYKNYGAKTMPVKIAGVFAFDLVSMNTSKNLFSLRPESYDHIHSYSYGLTISKTLKDKDWMIESGFLYTTDEYLHMVEGSFGPQSQYGKIMTLLNPEYVSIPLLVGWTDVNNRSITTIKIGYRADLLQNLNSRVIAIGQLSAMDIAAYTYTINDYNRVRSNVIIALGFDRNLRIGQNRLWVRVDPMLDVRLTPDQKAFSAFQYKPVSLSVNTGLVYNVPYNASKHNKKVAERKKKRDARKLKKKQEHDKKQKEKEEREKKKQEEEKKS